MAKETPAQKQARARALHEMESMSYRDIATTVGISLRTVANWAERGMPNPVKGQWVKGAHASKVQQKAEESILEVASRVGLTHEFLLGKVKELCTATKPVLVKPSKAEQEKAQKEGDESGGGFVTEIPDYNAIDAGLTHAERIIPGLKAAETISHDFPAEMLAFFQGGGK